MNEKLKEKIRESLSSVLPITIIVLVLSITLVPMEIGTLALFLAGAVLLIVGMGFFQLGAEMSMTPLGQGVGGRLVKSKRLPVIVVVCFLMGAIITISEPDLQVLANQVASIPNNVLIWTVAVGVGIFLAAAVLRILFRVSLSRLLMVLYILLFILSFFSPSEFTSVAFDAGGVTTGPMTVPFIMAVGIGLSAARSDKEGEGDSFGLIALCSIGPIMMVLLLGIFYLGTGLAESTFQWLLVPIGIVIGYYIVKAEPAVQVLNEQVEDLTGGAVSRGIMNVALSVGVAGAVALAMVRVLTGINIYWVVIPGYIIALALSRFVPKVFVGIAFDSGGVASGPMTSTFLLPLAMGASTAIGGNVVTDAFGIVALVALAPLIAVQLMGVMYEHRSGTVPQLAEELSDDIVVEFEEEKE